MTDTASPWYRHDTWSLEDGFGLGRAGDQVARMALEVDPRARIGYPINLTERFGSCSPTSRESEV